jgi:hypothetical protein
VVGKDDGSSAHVDHVLFIFEEVGLGAHEDLEGVGALFLHLWEPLVEGVVEGARIDEGEADEEDVGVGKGEGSQSLVLLLPSSVPAYL